MPDLDDAVAENYLTFAVDDCQLDLPSSLECGAWCTSENIPPSPPPPARVIHWHTWFPELQVESDASWMPTIWTGLIFGCSASDVPACGSVWHCTIWTRHRDRGQKISNGSFLTPPPEVLYKGYTGPLVTAAQFLAPFAFSASSLAFVSMQLLQKLE
jgi:hypothetical protein